MEPQEIVPDLFIIPFPVGHAYLWRDEDALTLIDAGAAGSGPAVAAAIKGLGLDPGRLRRIVLTHFHPDHAGGAAEIGSWTGVFGPVTVMAGAADAPVIRGDRPGAPPVLLDWERPIFEGLPPLPPAPPARVDRELTDGDAIDFGGGARVVAVPGHTDGSIAIHLPHRRVLFTGDAVANMDGRTMLGVFNTDRERAIASLRRMSELDGVETACFGHGDPISTGASAALRAVASASAG